MAAYLGALEKEGKLSDRFDAYCKFGKTTDAQTGLTSKNLLKMMKEANLIDGRLLSVTTLDLIFVRVASRGAKKIQYQGFLEVLDQCAAIKGVRVEELHRSIIDANGPKLNSTSPVPAIRLHDDKSAYTGVHKAGGPSVKIDSPLSLDAITDRSHADVRGVKIQRSQQYYDVLIKYFTKHNPDKIAKVPSLLKIYAGREEELFAKIEAKYGEAIMFSSSLSQTPRKATTPPHSSKNIYDKLTDTSLYTGSHRHRFDPNTGRGRGLDGRDSIAKGGGLVPHTPSSAHFEGNTNTNTDQNFFDSSQFLMR